MEQLKLIFQLLTTSLLDSGFQSLYLPLLCMGIVGFVFIFVKRRICGYV